MLVYFTTKPILSFNDRSLCFTAPPTVEGFWKDQVDDDSVQIVFRVSGSHIEPTKWIADKNKVHNDSHHTITTTVIGGNFSYGQTTAWEMHINISGSQNCNLKLDGKNTVEYISVVTGTAAGETFTVNSPGTLVSLQCRSKLLYGKCYPFRV